MKNIVLFLTIFASFSLFGQTGRLKKADGYYNQLAYSLALPIYEELIGSEVDSPKMKSKLAFCYFQNSLPIEAEKTYREVVNTPDATEDDYFYFAQSLKQNNKYAESDQWMEKVKMKKESDLRSDKYIMNKNYLKEIEDQGINFEIQNLKVNTTESDFGGYPTYDGKSVYFVSARKKKALIQRDWSWNNHRFLDLYKATPDNIELTNPSVMKKKVNSKFHEGPVSFTPDGKMVYFTRNNVAKGKMRKDQKGIQNLKMYVAPVDANGLWGAEKEIAFNSKDYSVGHPSISKDGKTMYFASDMPGTLGGADIWKCTINTDGSLGKPENLGKSINTEGQEMFPFISPEGNLFFSSNGQIGLGGLDVFVCLNEGESNIGNPINVGKPVNSTADDFSFSLNHDGMTGYFSSNRSGGRGSDDIYWFKQIKPFKKQLFLEGITMEKGTNAILSGADITLVAPDGTRSIVKADANGKYSFPVEKNLMYSIEVKKDNYFNYSTKLSTESLDPSLTVINKNIDLEKDPGLALYALVTESKTNLPIEGVKIIIIDNVTKQPLIDATTPSTGDDMKGLVGKKVGDKLSYTIQLQKEGYFPKTVQFNYVINKPGIVKVHEALAGALTMDKEVKDLRELVQINDIRFDLNKDFIRPDAALELDKVVAVMNKYPNMVIELGSHTDCRSSYKYNKDLSDRRAKNSAAYIKARITNPARIYGKGYGEYRLLNDCKCEGAVKSTCTNEQHDVNRRTEFKIISIGSDKVDVINTSTQSFDKK
jgi:outer membrane protein OmpA-like peptidoglycan-associated protein